MIKCLSYVIILKGKASEHSGAKYYIRPLGKSKFLTVTIHYTVTTKYNIDYVRSYFRTRYGQFLHTVRPISEPTALRCT